MTFKLRTAIIATLALVLALSWAASRPAADAVDSPKFSELYSYVQTGQVASVTIIDNTGEIRGEYRDGKKFKTVGPKQNEKFLESLKEHGVVYAVEPDNANLWTGVLGTLFPLLLFPVLLIAGVAWAINRFQAARRRPTLGTPGASH